MDFETIGNAYMSNRIRQNVKKGKRYERDVEVHNSMSKLTTPWRKNENNQKSTKSLQNKTYNTPD